MPIFETSEPYDRVVGVNDDIDFHLQNHSLRMEKMSNERLWAAGYSDTEAAIHFDMKVADSGCLELRIRDERDGRLCEDCGGTFAPINMVNVSDREETDYEHLCVECDPETYLDWSGQMTANILREGDQVRAVDEDDDKTWIVNNVLQDVETNEVHYVLSADHSEGEKRLVTSDDLEQTIVKVEDSGD